MPILPAWQGRLSEQQPAENVQPVTCTLPRSPAFYAGRTTFVDDISSANAMAELAQQRPIAWAGLDTEFRYDRPGVRIDAKRVAFDPRSIRPLLLSLSLAEPDSKDGIRLYDFVVDLRRPDLLPAVQAVLRLPVCFVGHFAQAELFCLFRLGLTEPAMLWDTWVHEKALHLGRGTRSTG
jgi:DNA polymerase I